jgi:hypothetical protein
VPDDNVEPSRADRSSADRTSIDQHGIKHVVNFELSANRMPDVQPHNNPGYDIESFFDDGTLARVIEVKSISGRWGERGVTLSKRQLEENQSRGSEFWLYVVEYAGDSARARVIPVRNPYERAGSFVFDGGWAGLSDQAQDS